MTTPFKPEKQVLVDSLLIDRAGWDNVIHDKHVCYTLINHMSTDMSLVGHATYLYLSSCIFIGQLYQHHLQLQHAILIKALSSMCLRLDNKVAVVFNTLYPPCSIKSQQYVLSCGPTTTTAILDNWTLLH